MRYLERVILMILRYINTPFITGVAFVVIPSVILLLTHVTKLNDKIEVANLLIQVIVAISATFAVITYFERRDEKKLRLALEVINFYRENILRLQTEIIKTTFAEKGQKYELPKVINFDITKLKSDVLHPDAESKKDYLDFLQIKNIEVPQVELLNMMEEFSLRIRAYHLQTYPVMQSVKESFVKIVEQGGIQRIVQVRAAGTSEHSFKEILSLYDLWRHNVSRKSEKERINDFFEKEVVK